MENGLSVLTKNEVSLIMKNELGELIKPLHQEVFLYDSYVAGTTYVKDRSVFDELGEDDELILQREPDNRFDENAILLFDKKKRKVGYVPEKDNPVFARLMDAGKMIKARIRNVETDISSSGSVYTRVDISLFLIDF